MKRIALFLVTLLLIVTSAAAQTGKNIYQRYSDSPGVSAVYISPAMFRLIGRIPDIQIRGDNYDFAPVIKSLSGLYLLTSKNIPVSTKIITEVNRLVATDNYELLMEAKDNDETVRMQKQLKFISAGIRGRILCYAVIESGTGGQLFVIIIGFLS